MMHVSPYLRLSYPRMRVSRGHDAAAQVGADRRSRRVKDSASDVASWIPAFAGMTWDLRARPVLRTCFIPQGRPEAGANSQ